MALDTRSRARAAPLAPKVTPRATGARARAHRLAAPGSRTTGMTAQARSAKVAGSKAELKEELKDVLRRGVADLGSHSTGAIFTELESQENREGV